HLERQHQITVFVAEAVLAPLAGFIQVCEIPEIKSPSLQAFDGYFGLALRVQLFQYLSVFLQNAIDRPNITEPVRFPTLIIITPAGIVAEFLIDAPYQGAPTIQAFAFHISLKKIPQKDKQPSSK